MMFPLKRKILPPGEAGVKAGDIIGFSGRSWISAGVNIATYGIPLLGNRDRTRSYWKNYAHWKRIAPMGIVHVGLNAEFSRSSDKPFEWAVEHAAKMGYKRFEPMAHFGRELMSEAGYFHTVSMFDPYAHHYPLWQERWELLLGGAKCSQEKQANLFGPARGDQETLNGAANVNVSKAWHWPTAEQLAKADVIIAFCYPDWDDERFAQMRQYLERGGGLVAVHSATWPLNKQQHEAGWLLSKQRFPRAAEVLGIGGYQKFRHGRVDMRITKPEHPLCTGLPEEIEFHDETYWPPTPRMDGVEVLATSDEIIDGFRDPGALETFDWEFNKKTIHRFQMEEVATGEFVRRGENLVWVGQSGVGKSRLIQGIGRRLCVAGYRVYYTTSAELVEDLAASRADDSLSRRLRGYGRWDVT